MEARALGDPLLATLQIQIEGLLSTGLNTADTWDSLMERLLAHPGIVDPVVSNNVETGTVWISYEFEATGNVQADVPKALSFLVEATRDEPVPAFDWEQWLGGPTSVGTVQYPAVYA